MKTWTVVLFVTLIVAQGFAQTVDAAEQSMIRTLVQHYLDARAHADAKAVAALFTAEADQLVSSGQWRNGREAIAQGALASSKATGGERTIVIEKMRAVAAGVVIADARYQLSGLSGGVTRNMWSTFVVVRTNGGWRIAAIRNMLPAKPAPTR